jgi:hypothetical protein
VEVHVLSSSESDVCVSLGTEVGGGRVDSDGTRGTSLFPTEKAVVAAFFFSGCSDGSVTNSVTVVSFSRLGSDEGSFGTRFNPEKITSPPVVVAGVEDTVSIGDSEIGGLCSPERDANTGSILEAGWS